MISSTVTFQSRAWLYARFDGEFCDRSQSHAGNGGAGSLGHGANSSSWLIVDIRHARLLARPQSQWRRRERRLARWIRGRFEIDLLLLERAAYAAFWREADSGGEPAHLRFAGSADIPFGLLNEALAW